jgi:hypothetical protein
LLVFGRHEGIRSDGEVNELINRLLGEVCQPDLAHEDLAEARKAQKRA